MRLHKINSENNKKLKFIKSLKQKKNRHKHKKYILEGIKPIIEGIEEDAPIDEIFISEEFLEKEFENYGILKKKKINLINNKTFEKITDTVNSQGIFATVNAKLFSIEDIIPFGRYILLDELSDPGNMGGIIRGADAFSFDGVIVGPKSVDVLNEKVIRSTMASIFRVEIFIMKDKSEMEYLKKRKFRIYSTTLKEGSKPPSKVDLSQNIILVIGNEAHGVSEEMENYSDGLIHIPMSGNAESLNANVSGNILMYESERQRNK